MKTLRDLIADGRVHVVDGAMGTMLYGRGMFLNICYDELNLKQPDLVRDIHREYVRAGAELIETNTFGANPHQARQLRLSGGDGADQHRGGRSGTRRCRRRSCGHWSRGAARDPNRAVR